MKSERKEEIVGSDHVSRAKELGRDLHGMCRTGTRLAKDVADVLQVMVDRKDGPGALLAAYRAKQVPGSDLFFSMDECTRFVREFGGVKDADCSKWAKAKEPAGAYWPIPDAGWTYEELAALCAKVPHYDWTLDQLRRVDGSLDKRQPDKAGRLLWTPAGLESTQACPELVGVSYRRLWEMQEKVVNGREAVILWLLVYWKYQIMLDTTGWTRTCSRCAGGGGVSVSASGQGLHVGWCGPGGGDPGGGSRSLVLG